MKKNNALNDIFKTIENILFIKYALPILLIILIGLLVIQFGYNSYLSLTLDNKENIIYHSNFDKTIQEIA